MIIYDKNSIEILDIQVDDSSVRYRSIMNDDSLTLNFSSVEPVTILRGSYVVFEGARYTLFYPENFKKHSTRNFEYTLILHGYREALKLYKFKDLSAKPYRLKFPLTARPSDFLKLLVDCMNLHDAGWSAGDCIVSEEKLISFNHEYCFDVLNRIATEFNTEWEIAGKVIHLRKVEKFKDDPLPLSYGMGNGFKTGVGRSNDGDRQPIGLLYVQGGERNIDYSTYGSGSLLLPKNATLLYEGKTYRTDADGMYITRDGNTNIAEDSFDASSHYPKRVGTVSSAIVVDADNHFYDIIDSSIPDNLNYRDCRIAGEKATIVFQSGALAGREFDLEQTDADLTGYIHAERRFKIVPAELDGITMPGGVFVPKTGDKYAIFNISMPAAYISDNPTQTGASWDMFREAVRYFADEEKDKFSFTGDLDGVWSRSRWLEIGGKIVPGGHVLFSDPQFQPDGVLIRITAIKDYVNSPHKPEITLSNASVTGSFSADLGRLEAEEVIRAEEKKEVIRFSKRQWRDAIETMSMLENAMLNFGEGISPLTVQTMQLLVGDESLQFRFVNSKTNPQRVSHNVTFNTSTKALTASAGILQHMTIGIVTLKKSHAASEYKFWDMASYTSPALEADKAYYLYARCAKSGTTGVFLLSETAIGMESVANQYHFLLGILNSEQDGDRSFAPLYGYTEVLPGRITTDKIVSQDGKTYVDLIAGIIGGRIRFLSSGVETELDQWAEVVETGITDAISAAEEVQTSVDNLGGYVEGAFKDGVIDSAEAKAIEKYINTINEIMAKAEASYTKVYANTYLEGTAKTNLLNAKINLWGQRDTLISAINTAIADGKTTVAEKTAVDNAFNAFNTLMSAFQSALEDADKAIQAKLDAISKGYVNDLQIGGVNIISNLPANWENGYWDANGNPIANNSYIRTKGFIPINALQEYIAQSASAEQLTFRFFNSSNVVIQAEGRPFNVSTPLKFKTIAGVVKFKMYTCKNGAPLITPADITSMKIKVEKGNKETDYSPSVEDVEAAINKALAVANKSAAVTDKFGTTIDGGLVGTVMILLRELNSLQETAGISGIQGAMMNNPAFWAGGTYAQAFALIQFLLKISNGTAPSAGEYDNLAKITMLHSGAAKVGDFIIEESGRIIMVDPATGRSRLEFGVNNIPFVTDLMSGTSFQGSVNITSGSLSKPTEYVYLGGILQVTKNSSTIVYNGGTLSIHAASSFAGVAYATLRLSRDGRGANELGSTGLFFDEPTGLMVEKNGTLIIPKTTIQGMSAGTYRVELVLQIGGVVDYADAGCTGSTLSWSFVQAGVRRQQYGLDGMMFFYSNNHLHYTESNGLDIRGATNMPGVLLSATVNAGGGWFNVWGAKKSTIPAARNGPGDYTVYHSIGHTKYQVIVTTSDENRTWLVKNKTASSFNVVLRTVFTGQPATNSTFDVVAIGDNYAT